MEDELLKELDSILQPTIQQSWQSAKNISYGSDPKEPFLDLLKIQIDNTKFDISNTLQKLDLSIQGSSCNVERAAADFDRVFPNEQLPNVKDTDYVRQINGGFEVWDGMRWVQLSDKANINVEIFQNPDNNNRPAVRVWAKDSETETSVLFVDNDVVSPGWDLSMTQIGNFENDSALVSKNGYWEAPMYNIAKNSIGVGGMVAGALEINQFGNITPWRTGDALRNANGWFRTKEGVLRNLSNQRARGAHFSKKGAKNALERSTKWSKLGKKFFYVGAVISIGESAGAYVTDDANKEEVLTKATVDIVIGAIGIWGGPIGWAIAGTYFILDVSGAFGDWGKPTGMSQSDYDKMLIDDVHRNYGNRFSQLEFDVDYVPSTENSLENWYLEERQIKRDNTRVVTPKLLFNKD